MTSVAVLGGLFAPYAASRASEPPPGRALPASLEASKRVARQPRDYASAGVVVRFRKGSRGDRATDAIRALAPHTVRWLDADSALLRLPETADPVAAAHRLSRMAGVAAADPNVRFSLEAVPTDPFFGEQWGLLNTGQAHEIADPPPTTSSGTAGADIDATQAWDVTTGSPETVIAVLDTGVDFTNPDLSASLWVNPGEIAANGIDDDGNGYVDDVNGWDFADDDAAPADVNGHGSSVAGIVAAAMNNAQGTVGVCPGCRIMVLRWNLRLDNEIEAIRYAIDNGADIFNASYAIDVFVQNEFLAFHDLTAAGVLPVISAGNEAGNNDMLLPDVSWSRLLDAPLFPASFDLPGILSVAATNDHDEYGYATGCAIAKGAATGCYFTNIGHDSVDLAAPGVDIFATALGGQMATVDGTSMSAPFVSGVAGLVESLHPEYSMSQLRNAVLNGVERPDSLGRGLTATNGRTNALSALTASAGSSVRSAGNITTARNLSGRSSGRLAYPTNVNDVFKARLRRGKRYGVSLAVARGKDFDLYVWKPGTSQVWQLEPGCDAVGRCRWLLTSSARGKGKDEFVSFRAKKAGVYYFQATSWFSSGRYTLRLGRL
jgi:subtilisin family serine protease